MGFFRAIAWTLVKRLIHIQFPEVQSLSTTKLAECLSQAGIEKPLLLDARTLEEYEVSHLLGAHLAPSNLEELSRWKNLTRSTPIVTYCSVGYRSALLARKLQAIGYTAVFNLEGSIFQWANEARPIYRETQRVRQVHPFNPGWGLLLNSALHSSNS